VDSHYGHAVRLVDPNRLMGTAEIRLRLGVGQTRLRAIAKRPDFPKPVKTLTAGDVWDGEEIDAWIAEHRPPREIAEDPEGES